MDKTNKNLLIESNDSVDNIDSNETTVAGNMFLIINKLHVG